MPHAAVQLTENTLGARLTLRREVFELCLLPLAPLLPLLPDSPAALQVRCLRGSGRRLPLRRARIGPPAAGGCRAAAAARGGAAKPQPSALP